MVLFKSNEMESREVAFTRKSEERGEEIRGAERQSRARELADVSKILADRF